MVERQLAVGLDMGVVPSLAVVRESDDPVPEAILLKHPAKSHHLTIVLAQPVPSTCSAVHQAKGGLERMVGRGAAAVET